MPYVQRDSTGRVVALYLDTPADGAEFLSGAHPDVLLFLETNTDQLSEEDRRRLFVTLDASTIRVLEDIIDPLGTAGKFIDSSMIRVVEDIIDLLIQKHLIEFTDLPPEARQKILARKATRERQAGSTGLVGLNRPT